MPECIVPRSATLVTSLLHSLSPHERPFHARRAERYCLTLTWRLYWPPLNLENGILRERILKKRTNPNVCARRGFDAPACLGSLVPSLRVPGLRVPGWRGSGSVGNIHHLHHHLE